MVRVCSESCREEIEEKGSMTSYASSQERKSRKSQTSTSSSESVCSLIHSYALSGTSNPIDKVSKLPKKTPDERIHIGNMTLFPFPETGFYSTPPWLDLGFKASLDGEKGKLYYADSTIAPEYLNLRVEMHRLCCMPYPKGRQGVSEWILRPGAVNPPRPRPQHEQVRQPGFCRLQVEGAEHIERVAVSPSVSQAHRAPPTTGEILGTVASAASIPAAPVPAAPTVAPVTQAIPYAPVMPAAPTGRAEDAVILDTANSSNGTEGLRNALAEWDLYDDVWRPGDEIIPPTDPDFQPIPNFLPKFDPSEETTLSAIRELGSHTLLRLKRKYKSVFSLASLRNNYASSSRQSVINNRVHKLAWKKTLMPPGDDVLDIIERRKALTGRRLAVGSTEIRILPTLNKTKLLYYLTKDGDGLLVTINDLGKWSADAYPEYKDDLVILRWLIDTCSCMQWRFTTDNLYCNECVSSWKMKVISPF